MLNELMKAVVECRSCQSKNIKSFFDMGHSPNANSLLDYVDQKEMTYPLALCFCHDCNLAQLSYTVDPSILFSHYVWVTGTSKGAVDWAEEFCKKLLGRCRKADGYVLEIASNDGTFLKPFAARGLAVLGVDPANNIVAIAEAAGVPTQCAFWGKRAAADLLAEKGAAGIVFARNVLAHVANLNDFVEGLAAILHPTGVLAIEVHYARHILAGLQYDAIYHEHLCYFSLKTIERLLLDHGLFVFAVEPSPISGGALVVYCDKRTRDEEASVKQCRVRELEERVNDLARWREFAVDAHDHREQLRCLLEPAKSGGVERVVGWGASARSSTLLNFCGINNDLILAIIDKNPLKQGKFTAGTRIPIVFPDKILQMRPNQVVVLAWNFKEEIVRELKERFNFRGSFLVPLPNWPVITLD